MLGALGSLVSVVRGIIAAWLVLEETIIEENCLGLCGCGQKQGGLTSNRPQYIDKKETNIKLSQSWVFLNFSYLSWRRAELWHKLKIDILKLMS